jgi:Zn-dependent protease with chaperone function
MLKYKNIFSKNNFVRPTNVFDSIPTTRERLENLQKWAL